LFANRGMYGFAVDLEPVRSRLNHAKRRPADASWDANSDS
jgi:hypothetical protein